MYKYFIAIFMCFTMCAANAATPAAGRGRASTSANTMRSSPRAGVASKTQIASAPSLNAEPVDVVAPVTTTASAPTTTEPVAVDKSAEYEKQKNACIGNNVGLNNTFVWASRYSNTNNYAMMVEDINQPENNTCFVKVELMSTDERIDVDDIEPKYFAWGNDITCGSWVDEDMLEKRILDAKKKNRTWATVGGAAGGAVVGVGAMELFGNKLIGGKVMGQRALEGEELMLSQVLVLKNKGDSEYEKWEKQLKILKENCEGEDELDEEVQEKCEKYDSLYNELG